MLIDRIGLEKRRALTASILDCGSQEVCGDTTAPHPSIQEEARDRPHWRVIDTLQDAGTLEALEGIARSHRAPSDRLAGEVCENSDGEAVTNERRHT